MRVMAVDYGDARTGLAFSDISRSLVGETLVIHSKNVTETAQRIASEAASRDVSVIVVGHPKNMDGSIGGRAKKSERLAEEIARCAATAKPGKPVDIILRDERLTTVDAHRILTYTGKRGKKRKQTVDAVAASLILESYLGEKNHTI